MLQGDLVAALLLHALWQTADGDLAAHAEPVWRRRGKTKGTTDPTELNQLFVIFKSECMCVSRDLPCCDDVRKLWRVGSNLHRDRLEEHELLADTDGVGARCHVLQTERAVLLAEDCRGGQ